VTNVNLARTGLNHPMAFTNLEDVSLIGGQFNDIIDVESTGDPISIDGGGGSDTFVVGDGDIDSHILDDIAILGGAALGPNDHLILDDQLDTNNDNYFLTDTTFNKFNFLGTSSMTKRRPVFLSRCRSAPEQVGEMDPDPLEWSLAAG
jgi:hypothetical protein